MGRGQGRRPQVDRPGEDDVRRLADQFRAGQRVGFAGDDGDGDVAAVVGPSFGVAVGSAVDPGRRCA